MTEEEFRVISHINKDNGATGALENFIAIYLKKDISIPKLSLVIPVRKQNTLQTVPEVW